MNRTHCPSWPFSNHGTHVVSKTNNLIGGEKTAASPLRTSHLHKMEPAKEPVAP